MNDSMSDSPAKGAPYSGPGAAEIDDWSERVYRALSTWPIAQTGEWSRWEPGYLLLTINRAGDEPIEPVMLDTADQELTVTCGRWHDHLDREGSEEATLEALAEQAKALIGDWLNGKFQIAVYSDTDERWCGSTVIRPGDLDAQLEETARHLRHLTPTSIELQSVHKRDWKILAVKPDWLTPPVLPPNRLP